MDQKLSTDRLFRRMELERVTTSQLAKGAGISRQAMYNIINAKSQPKASTLEKICEVLHCSPESLMGRDGCDIDHARFADVLVERREREGIDFDAEAATMEYIRNWVAETYNDLTYEQFKAVKAEAEREGQGFAQNVAETLTRFAWLTVSEESQKKVMEEVFVLFFEVLPHLTESELDIDLDFHIFDGEEYA